MVRRWIALDLRVRLALLAVIAAVVLPAAWYLGAPLFIDQVVDEALPAAPAQPAARPAAAAGPVALSSGQFNEIDAIHKGQGKATIYMLPDGKRVLRFEEFRVTNGPDLYVYLAGHAAPRDSRQLHAGAVHEVARLKGNAGDQNYELPDGLDLAAFKSVVIYCKQFSVVFSTAALS
jgi:hypothetical protein